MTFTNAYADAQFADAYSRLQFPGTYDLAYRDLPDILAAHARGSRALDFGCGAGRSTRFLRERGFEVVGVDIAASMLARAKAADPDGDYRLMEDESLAGLAASAFDLVFSAFTLQAASPGRG